VCFIPLCPYLSLSFLSFPFPYALSSSISRFLLNSTLKKTRQWWRCHAHDAITPLPGCPFDSILCGRGTARTLATVPMPPRFSSSFISCFASLHHTLPGPACGGGEFPAAAPWNSLFDSQYFSWKAIHTRVDIRWMPTAVDNNKNENNLFPAAYDFLALSRSCHLAFLHCKSALFYRCK
jgi:hypothetical protein